MRAPRNVALEAEPPRVHDCHAKTRDRCDNPECARRPQHLTSKRATDLVRRADERPRRVHAEEMQCPDDARCERTHLEAARSVEGCEVPPRQPDRKQNERRGGEY